MMNLFKTTTLLCALLGLFSSTSLFAGFKHPGVLHTRAELDAIKAKIAAGQQPWRAALEDLRDGTGHHLFFTPCGGFADYAFNDLKHEPRPRSIVDVGHNSTPCSGENELYGDTATAYIQALLWYLTEDTRYAENVQEILEAWSDTLVEVRGENGPLLSAHHSIRLARAAELLRHTYPGWDSSLEPRLESLFRDIFLPQFQNKYEDGNWSTAAMEALVSVGVYLDDQALFDKGLAMWLAYCDDYIEASGINSETCRDQIHAQWQTASGIQLAEIAWDQGYDVYSHLDNRLLTTLEYTANILLGNPPNPDPACGQDWNRDVVWHPAAWDIAINHFVNRKGLSMPLSVQLMSEPGTRPDYIAFHMGLGTLTHYGIGEAGGASSHGRTYAMLMPSADTYLDSNHGGNGNYAESSLMYVQSDKQIALFGFPADDLPYAHKATFEMTTHANTQTGTLLLKALSNDWDEYAANYLNRPERGVEIGRTDVSVEGIQTIRVDITDYFNANRQSRFSLALEGLNAGEYIQLATMDQETLPFPKILIEYAPKSLEAYLRLHSIDNSEQDLLEDPDEDGLNNLLEYALASDPHANSALVITSRIEDSQLLISLESQHTVLPSDLGTTLERTHNLQDLASWEPVLNAPLPVTGPAANGRTLHTWPIDLDFSNNRRLFYRLRFTHP